MSLLTSRLFVSIQILVMQHGLLYYKVSCGVCIYRVLENNKIETENSWLRKNCKKMCYVGLNFFFMTICPRNFRVFVFFIVRRTSGTRPFLETHTYELCFKNWVLHNSRMFGSSEIELFTCTTTLFETINKGF